MRIVIDCRESGTSTGRYIDKLVEYLAKIDPSYRFILLAKPHRTAYLAKIAPKWKVVETAVQEFTFAEQTQLLSQVQACQPDLVFFPMVQQPIRYRGKVVTTMQDLTGIRFRNPAKNRLIFGFKQMVYRYVNKRVARRSTKIITPSEFVKKDVTEYCGIDPKKITVTYEAADKITEKPQTISELKGKRFIMYVGRPQPHKNLQRLVQAFALLQKKDPSLYLVLAGKTDPLFAALQEEVQQKSVPNVVFTGWISDGQLRWLYEHTAGYVFPSLSEGFGLPGLEAMVHGAPVVSSNATCLPEIYRDAALYFDPLSVDDIAEKIQQVLNDKTLVKRLVSRGKQVAGSYSWNRMAEQTLEVFTAALKNK